MIVQVFSIYDTKARIYSRPFFAINGETAGRMFGAAALDASTELAKYPLDFFLFHVGSFNDEQGVFDNLPAPVNLGAAATYINAEKGQLANAS